MKGFHEHTTAKQLGIVAAMIGFMGTPVGGLMIYAGDKKLDEKYATDEDVLSVQQTVERQVTTIKTTVEANTRTVSATARSVDGLTLVVMDLQIERLDEEIRTLEREKSRDPGSWNNADADTLRDKKRSLHDLELQRDALFQRLMVDARRDNP